MYYLRESQIYSGDWYLQITFMFIILKHLLLNYLKHIYKRFLQCMRFKDKYPLVIYRYRNNGMENNE